MGRIGEGSSLFLVKFHGILNMSSEFSAEARSIGTLFEQIGLRAVGKDMSKSQRHTRSKADRWMCQANGAAIHSKLPGLCQHVSGIMRKWKKKQASYGCLVGLVCMGVRIPVFAS